MEYALGIGLGILQFALLWWAISLWPLPFALLGAPVGLSMAIVGFSILTSPYVGEIHAFVLGGLLTGCLYTVISALLLGRPFLRSLSIALFGISMVFPVNWMIVLVRDNYSRRNHLMDVEGTRLWSEACDRMGLAFTVSWLLTFLLLPPILLAIRAKGGPAAAAPNSSVKHVRM